MSGIPPEPRFCEHCGSDRYAADHFSRTVTRMRTIEKDRERMAMDHAREEAKLRLEVLDAKASLSNLQAKARRQRAALNRLEKKLVAQGKVPYEGDSPWQRKESKEEK